MKQKRENSFHPSAAAASALKSHRLFTIDASLVKRLIGLICDLEHLFILCRSEIVEEEIDGIEFGTALPHFVMQMRRGGFTGTADISDQVTAIHFLSFTNHNAAQVRIHALVADHV